MHNHSDQYTRNINKALDALVTALASEQTPNLDELADVAC